MSVINEYHLRHPEGIDSVLLVAKFQDLDWRKQISSDAFFLCKILKNDGHRQIDVDDRVSPSKNTVYN